MPANQQFQDFIADLKAEIDNQNDKTEDALKRATIHQLWELSSVRSSFMEGSFEFSTVADTAEYDDSVINDWPNDLLEIYVLYGVDNDSRYYIEGPVPIEAIRTRAFLHYSYPWPELWSWHADKLVFGPTPSDVQTIRFDYMKDATLDETGAEITVSSTTATNNWFGRGRNALRACALWEYHMSVGKDYEIAAFYEMQKLKAIESIENEWHMRGHQGAQSAFWYGGQGWTEGRY